MRKFLSVFLTLCLLFILPVFAEDIRLPVADATVKSGVVIENGISKNWQAGYYIGFSQVNLTDIRSVTIHGSSIIPGIENGDAYQIRIDDPVKGDCLGYVLFNEAEKLDADFFTNIKEVSGVHDLYIKSTYGQLSDNIITEITLSASAVDEGYKKAVSPDAIIDNYADTWCATDALGRKLADYEEVGAVKPGLHEVSMFYWNWRTKQSYDSNARIPSVIVSAFPESRDDYYHSAWDTHASYSWAEPLFGFYNSLEYWVYRRHAEMLANAGVDTIFLDMSNDSWAFIPETLLLFNTFADAREAGVAAPSIYVWSSSEKYSLRSLYHNIFPNERLRDMWYQWNGKYLVFGADVVTGLANLTDEDVETRRVYRELADQFITRKNGSRAAGDTAPTGSWQWLQNYPQTKWGKTDDYRVECVPVGSAINHSYVFNYEKTGVFSDPYTKGRSYTEAFGEDYRPEAVNYGYFFREQASRALSVDPAIVVIDGWNEWNAVRNAVYSGFTNAFVDTYDDENSRDFEPSAGILRDDYYMLLIDFIRRYKGVRPAPVASAPKTIEINGDVAQWEDVAPLYYNVVDDYERDGIGMKNPDTNDNYHFKTTVRNAISRVKVARTDEAFTFLVTTKNDVRDGDDFMHLYIDIDRNHATGWEGYDFAVNVTGKDEVSAFRDGSWQKLANCRSAISGNTYTVAVDRSLLSEPVADFEFKFADGAAENGDILRFYEHGSVAPAGRFNYLYTEIAQQTLSSDDRFMLADTTVLKDGCARMNVNGGEMYVYEADTRITTFTENGTLYVPAIAADEILGYGIAKYEYDADKSMLFLSRHDLENAEITNYIWSYTVIGSLDARKMGRLVTLTAPVLLRNGIAYLPVTYFADVFGWTVTTDKDTTVISRNTYDAEAAEHAAALL